MKIIEDDDTNNNVEDMAIVLCKQYYNCEKYEMTSHPLDVFLESGMNFANNSLITQTITTPTKDSS